MNRIPILSMLAASAMLLIGSMITPTLAGDAGLDVHQFGAVSYLDDSGFMPSDYTNPNPQVDDVDTMLELGYTMAQIDSCAVLMAGEGGDPEPSGEPKPPADPAPEGGGTESSDAFCTLHLRL